MANDFTGCSVVFSFNTHDCVFRPWPYKTKRANVLDLNLLCASIHLMSIRCTSNPNYLLTNYSSDVGLHCGLTLHNWSISVAVLSRISKVLEVMGKGSFIRF